MDIGVLRERCSDDRQRLGEDVRAIEAFEQSISLDPTYVNPYRRASAWSSCAATMSNIW